jgi:chromosome segregation protein
MTIKSRLTASALGEKLNYLICERQTSERAERAVKFLEDNGLSRLSFIITEKIPDFYRKSDIGLPLGYVELIKHFRYNSEDEKIISFLYSDTLVCGNKIYGNVYGNVIVQGGGKLSFEKQVLIEDQINSRLEKERLGFGAIKTKTQIGEKHFRIEERKNELKSISIEINSKKTKITSFSGEMSVFEIRLVDYEN